MSHWSLRLSIKLTLCLVGCLIVAFALLAYQNSETYRGQLEEMTHASADSLSGVIRASTRDSMLQNHREAIAEIIEQIGVEQGIHRIRIYNKVGRISYSSTSTDVGTLVDKNAEACNRCHSADRPLSHLDRPDRVRVFTTEAGERVLGLIAPIVNEEGCHTASCHAHDPGQQVLGVLDVTMYLRDIDAAIGTGVRQLTLNLAVSAAAIAAVFAVLIFVMVHRPVRHLYAGTRRVASGDLDFKIDVTSRDEIGRLANSFNHMTQELRKARNELTEWGRSLEARVEEKTRELRAAQEQVVQVERLASMGKLAAIVAHEVNNPLAGILTSARLVLKRLDAGKLTGESAAPTKESLELIAGEAARCGDIVKSLLQFSRKSGGAYAPADPRTLVLESLRLVQHKLNLGGVRVRQQFDDAVPQIVCDQQEIKQAVVALIINACEAMREGEGELGVEVESCAGGETVKIAVRDNGIGMDEETHAHALEPFFSTKKEGSGVGLGLSVVSGILVRHSGRIEIVSAPGRGTTVTLVLPTHPKAEGVEKEADPAAKRSDPATDSVAI